MNLSVVVYVSLIFYTYFNKTLNNCKFLQAPDIAGQGIANPVGTILSAALLLRYSLGLHKEAEAVELAVRKTLDDVAIGGRGLRTGDLGGKTTTIEFGNIVIEELAKVYKN